METQEVRQRSPPANSPSGSQAAELAERRREARGCLEAISQHSYWFDLWVFLLFDLVLFIFVYLLP
uniref:Uncharacterized protein n=1 Tax=Leptobrachium leishanense TaxID=445787 RepID=A0A8C5LRI5_9ANUR